ncbi:MAG TPA: hypothetical protein VF458_08765 [Ktedonobacteraceae bacterium]
MSENPPLPQGDPLGACRGLASAMLITLALIVIALLVWLVLHLTGVMH